MTVNCRSGDVRTGNFSEMPEGRQTSVPLPPIDFIWGVGSTGETPDKTRDSYIQVGLACRHDTEAALGADWDWEGKALLDFGCGAGRFLRQVFDWAEVAEIHGCDLDEPMVEWARDNLCPPIAGIELNGFDPPLPYPDDHFDVVTAFSVFTHLGTNWAEWLLEVRRVLKPNGILIASILDQSCARALTDVPYEEDRVGMSIWAYANPTIPYVNVLHSHWWIREHWGRAFEIVSIESGSDEESRIRSLEMPGQGLVVARARDVDLSIDDLEREKPGEERYVAAHRHQQALFKAEADLLKASYRESETKVMLLEDAYRKLFEQTSNRSLRSKLRSLFNRD